MLAEFEIWPVQEMGKVMPASGIVVIDAGNLMTGLNEPLAKKAPEKAGATRDQNPGGLVRIHHPNHEMTKSSAGQHELISRPATVRAKVGYKKVSAVRREAAMSGSGRLQILKART